VNVAGIITLLRHAWARHRIPLIPIALAVGLFEFLLTRLAPLPDEVNWLANLMAVIPQDLRALAGNDVAVTAGGFLALGYGHPFFMVLMSVWVIRTSTAAVAGEVGLGTMDLLASRPVPRWHFVAAGMKTIALGLALIVASAWTGTAIGLHLRPLDVPASAYLPLAAGAWLLFAAWGSVALLISSTRRDGGQAVGWSTALLAASFVLEYLGRLWPAISTLRPLSLFRYYEVQNILASGLPRTSILVFGVTIIGGVLLSILAIQRRDL
jgi:ABC-type transport system involved in multi-copper enzyme maturation permease subunit